MIAHKHVKDALHRDNCQQLTDFLKASVEEGVAVHDEQCPTSWGVHHHPMLERVLEEFVPFMEEQTGKRLFPTYAYARLYKKGEVLKCHVDRPACEISATITLGFDKDVWPIFIADAGEETDQGIIGERDSIYRVKNINKIEMDVGDALIYSGCESPHWRDEFEGEWQTQIFLHYVDQDGPNAKHKFDDRSALSHHVNEENEECLYWFIPNAISHPSCDSMISKFEAHQLEKATIGFGDANAVDCRVRDVNKLQITNEIGIGATLTGMGLNINSRSWKFDITRSNQTEYLMYDKDGRYKTHVDTYMNPKDKESRKITILAFLNDDFEGGKFYLENDYKRIYPPQEKGTVLAFPSFMNHGVEPVKSGIRRSIVTWLVGPWFR